MSGISSISGSSSSLTLEQILAMMKAQSGTTTGSDATTTSSESTGSSATTSGNSLKDQLRTTILSALQEAEDSGEDTDLATVLQEAISEALQQSGGQAGASQAPSPPMDPPDFSDENNPLRSQLEAIGIEGDDLDNLMEQIDTAVTAAVEEAQSSGDTTDMRSVVENAIDETLEANGIDPEDVKPEMPAEGMQGGMMPPPPPPPADASSNADSSSSDSTESTTDDSNSQLLATLEELLSELGYSSEDTDALLGFLWDVEG